METRGQVMFKKFWCQRRMVQSVLSKVGSRTRRKKKAHVGAGQSLWQTELKSGKTTLWCRLVGKKA